MHDFFGLGVAGLGFFSDVVEEVEHQQGFLQAFSGHGSHFGTVEQLDQGVHVVATHHGTEQLGGLGFGDQADFDFTVRHGGQEGGLDLGGVVHTWGHAVGHQVHQKGVFASRWVLDQFDQGRDLLGVQRQGRNTQSGALGGMGTVIGEELGHKRLLRWVEKNQ